MIGISHIINKLINSQTPCSIVLLENESTNTLPGCIITDQDGVMIQFDYPNNGLTYVRLISDIQGIRFPIGT